MKRTCLRRSAPRFSRRQSLPWRRPMPTSRSCAARSSRSLSGSTRWSSRTRRSRPKTLAQEPGARDKRQGARGDERQADRPARAGQHARPSPRIGPRESPGKAICATATSTSIRTKCVNDQTRQRYPCALRPDREDQRYDQRHAAARYQRRQQRSAFHQSDAGQGFDRKGVASTWRTSTGRRRTG